MDPRKAADVINPLDYEEVFWKRVSKDPFELMTPKSERLFKASVIVVCVWALVEAPLELGGLINSMALLAVLASKVLMSLIGTAAIVNLRFTRHVFAFICGASVFAIAPALPLEYAHSVPVALFSTVECLGKAACVALFVIASMAGGSIRGHLRVGKRMAHD